MAKKRTPVTSVTPKSTVKPVSKAQQARTRKLIAGIASVTPVGRAAKAAITAAKTTKVVKTLAEPKSAVRVKPAAKTMGNPPNPTKAWEEHISSISRAGRLVNSAGKAKTKRVQKSKPTGKTVRDAKQPARIPFSNAEKTIVINSAKNTRIVKINPKPF